MSVTLAHPGNTASDGCHYCRTNCDKWGVEWGERHCHGNKTPTRGAVALQKSYTTESDADTWKYLVGTGIVGATAYFIGKKK